MRRRKSVGEREYERPTTGAKLNERERIRGRF